MSAPASAQTPISFLLQWRLHSPKTPLDPPFTKLDQYKVNNANSTLHTHILPYSCLGAPPGVLKCIGSGVGRGEASAACQVIAHDSGRELSRARGLPVSLGKASKALPSGVETTEVPAGDCPLAGSGGYTPRSCPCCCLCPPTTPLPALTQLPLSQSWIFRSLKSGFNFQPPGGWGGAKMGTHRHFFFGSWSLSATR